MADQMVPLITEEESLSTGKPTTTSSRLRRQVLGWTSARAGLIWLSLGSALIGALVSTGVHRLANVKVSSAKSGQPVYSQELPMCESTDAISLKAPRKSRSQRWRAMTWLIMSVDLWKNLDIQEAADLRSWLMDTERGLNLSSAIGAVGR